MPRTELLYAVEPGGPGELVDNARAYVRATSGPELLACYDAPTGGAQVPQPLYSGGDGYLHAWVELVGATTAQLEVDDNEGLARLVHDPLEPADFAPYTEVVQFAILSGRSHFELRARGDGSLAVTRIAATVDHGDATDLTDFIAAHSDEPAVAGALCDWQADGVITLTIEDQADTNQATLRGFLYLCLLSGRFNVAPEVQALIFLAPPTAPDLERDATTAVALDVDLLAGATGVSLELLEVGPAGHGATALLAGGLGRYTSAEGYTGPDAFTYVVRQSDGQTAEGTVSVAVAAP